MERRAVRKRETERQCCSALHAIAEAPVGGGVAIFGCYLLSVANPDSLSRFTCVKKRAFFSPFFSGASSNRLRRLSSAGPLWYQIADWCLFLSALALLCVASSRLFQACFSSLSFCTDLDGLVKEGEVGAVHDDKGSDRVGQRTPRSLFPFKSGILTANQIWSLGPLAPSQKGVLYLSCI